MKYTDSLLARTLNRMVIASIAAIALVGSVALADSQPKKPIPNTRTTSIQAIVTKTMRQYDKSRSTGINSSAGTPQWANLRKFYQSYHAQRWATLDDIAQDTFQFTNQLVVTPATVVFSINDNRLIVNSVPELWEGSNAVLIGQNVKHLKHNAQLFVIRVLGRNPDNQCEKDKYYCGLPKLEFIGNISCKDPYCRDQLNIPIT